MSRHVNRRSFLGASFALGPLLLAGRASQDSNVAQLYIPGFAGRPRDRITDYENDPFIVGLESGLRCTCGCNLDVYTCRTTDFTCGVSPAMHREVVTRVEDGKTGQQILDEFVATYGETVLMAPKKEGFNWAAYVVPGTAIAAIGSFLAFALLRRARSMTPSEALPSQGSVLADDERQLIEAELTKLGR